jgi:hypothetical protein
VGTRVQEMEAQGRCDAGDRIAIDARRVRIARSEKGPIYAAVCLRSLASRSADHQPAACLALVKFAQTQQRGYLVVYRWATKDIQWWPQFFAPHRPPPPPINLI